MFGLIGYLVAIILTADFVTGLGHWFEDRYCDRKWPIIGEFICGPNANHHADPLEFLNHGYWYRNWTTFAVVAPFVLLALLVGSIFWILVLLIVSQANEIHAWAHSKGKVNKWIAAAHCMGLLQSPKQHAEHHVAPFESRYCTITNWLNPILDATYFWRLLEVAVVFAFGINVRKG